MYVNELELKVKVKQEGTQLSKISQERKYTHDVNFRFIIDILVFDGLHMHRFLVDVDSSIRKYLSLSTIS